MVISVAATVAKAVVILVAATAGKAVMANPAEATVVGVTARRAPEVVGRDVKSLIQRVVGAEVVTSLAQVRNQTESAELLDPLAFVAIVLKLQDSVENAESLLSVPASTSVCLSWASSGMFIARLLTSSSSVVPLSSSQWTLSSR